jgi:hypothetical protein
MPTGNERMVQTLTWSAVNQIVGRHLADWHGAWGHRKTKKRVQWAQLGARILAEELGILKTPGTNDEET